MKRIDVELHACEVCERTIPRKRYPGGRLERPQKYNGKRSCGQPKCVAVIRERVKAESFEFIRPAQPDDHLRAVVAENRLVLGTCSRCTDRFVATEREVNHRRRTRCDYCMRKGGSRPVSYVRGQVYVERLAR